ncbi:uncharacterized protein BYT42DRAFT_561041 [Radiomyces spectabilis]|uniref:uncharacterized protein n=1 Tax=Radiomyces spectabilis TaxID=64574 RepID=UPI00221E5115|nr:uncharacterized protein BYT42DRAFT_561041 [Radiomyces spectabilis]KAI8388733.1 hypothetical protein BYT42DRAFT_561041 [Radiomyces spectabilis]
MADDFDDELYNVYNGAKEDSYSNVDIYGGDYNGTTSQDDGANAGTEGYEPSSSPTGQYRDQPEYDDQDQNGQHNEGSEEKEDQKDMRYSQQQMMMNNWRGFQANPYQYAAYQRNLQQMMNPYQMQQMFQRQMRQPQQQPMMQGNQDDMGGSSGSANHPVASAANQDEGKMFIGGLNWETTDDSLKQYFAQFGEVTDCVVMRDVVTGRSRGFAFLTMADPNVIDDIVNQDHYLDGKRIDPKRAIPREEQDKTEKIFVGGISPDVDEVEFREFFSQFGRVIDANLMTDRETGRPRGFGFITFDSSNGVEEALRHPNLAIKDKQIEVKRAMPKSRQARAQNSFNPAFSPGSAGRGYMPNSRYAGAASFGGPMGGGGRGYGFGNMYGGMYGGYGNYNMAAAYYANRGGYNMGYYGGRGGNNGGNYGYGGGMQGGYNNDGGHQDGGYDDAENDYEVKIGGHHDRPRNEERRYSRDTRDRSSDYGSSGRGGSGSVSGGGGGGALHASQSARNQHHYRPY